MLFLTIPKPAINPATAYASWQLEIAKRAAELADVGGVQGGSGARGSGAISGTSDRNVSARAVANEERELHVTEMLASKFWEAAGEAREVPPIHIAYYLFEAAGGERPCVMGDKCIARLTANHPLHDDVPYWTNPPLEREFGTARRAGIILKEYLTDVERDRFDTTGILPETHKPCILCIRCNVAFEYEMVKLGVLRRVAPTVYHPVDVPGGYRLLACIQPQKTSTKGISLPTRPYSTSDYIPTTLDEAAWAGSVPMTESEIDRLRRDVSTFVTTAHPRDTEARKRLIGQCGLPKIRGYIERGSVMYSSATKEMSPQAISMGTEPSVTYIPALAACATANADRQRQPPATGESAPPTAADVNVITPSQQQIQQPHPQTHTTFCGVDGGGSRSGCVGGSRGFATYPDYYFSFPSSSPITDPHHKDPHAVTDAAPPFSSPIKVRIFFSRDFFADITVIARGRRQDVHVRIRRTFRKMETPCDRLRIASGHHNGNDGLGTWTVLGAVHVGSERVRASGRGSDGDAGIWAGRRDRC